MNDLYVIKSQNNYSILLLLSSPSGSSNGPVYANTLFVFVTYKVSLYKGIMWDTMIKYDKKGKGERRENN